jgi:hypothetical protein
MPFNKYAFCTNFLKQCPWNKGMHMSVCASIKFNDKIVVGRKHPLHITIGIGMYYIVFIYG